MSSVVDDYEPDMNILIAAGLNPNSPVVPVVVQSFLSYLGDTPIFDAGFAGVDFEHDYEKYFPEPSREFARNIWDVLTKDYTNFVAQTFSDEEDFKNGY